MISNDNIEEKIDIVDINLKFIREGIRGEALRDGEYFKFIHVWVIKDSKFLIQKRSFDRNWAAGKWATHTGIVSQGESELDAAIRELQEEVSLKISAENMIFGFKVIPNNNFKGIGFIYIVKDYYNQDIKIDNVEVIDYKFVTKPELELMISQGTFVNYGKNGKEYNEYFSKVYKCIDELEV